MESEGRLRHQQESCEKLPNFSSEEPVCLGRGGFSVLGDVKKLPKVDQLLKFSIKHVDENNSIQGIGWLRWKNNQKLGIEFAQLGEKSKKLTIDWVNLLSPRSFIP